MHDSSSLVFANLVSAAGAPQLHENPLTRDLELPHRIDDARLLIALGELSGSPHPLTPRRMSRLEELVLLWLGDEEWIAIPTAGPSVSVEEALATQFPCDAAWELIPDGCFEILLKDNALKQLDRAPAIGLNGYPAEQSTPLSTRFCVRPWTSAIAYDLVLRREDLRTLQGWLSTQH